MERSTRANGFTLIEILAVLAILAILSVIAIPTYLGQRRRARVIGDAQANAAVLRMALESHKADAGIYGSASKTYSWTPTTSPAASTSPAPTFTGGGGNSRMNYNLVIGSTGLTYTLTVVDPSLNHSVFQTNQNGSNLYTMH